MTDTKGLALREANGAAGNTNAMKFKSPDDRQRLQNQYVEHVESGLSDECFPECDLQTLRRYLRDFPDDFDIDLIEVARRKRQLFWERAGRDGTMGQIDGFNAASWKFNMGNRFGWTEKREDTLKVKRDSAADLAKRVFDEEDDEAETSADEAGQYPEDSMAPEPEGVSAADAAEAVSEDHLVLAPNAARAGQR